MKPEKVHLTQEKETLLITLFAKAGESELGDSLLNDRYAAEALKRIDYDFARLKVGRDMMIGLAMRAHHLDEWARRFIERHPRCVVLHLGCGLDTRYFRIAPAPGVRWYDVDYPEVVDLRRRLFAMQEGYFLIASAVQDVAWLEQVPADLPVLVIAEGLLMYLSRDDVRALLGGIVSRFQHGEFICDALSSLGVRFVQRIPSVRATGAQLRWGIDDPRELEALAPPLKLAEEADCYRRDDVARFSLLSRISIGIMLAIPALRRMNHLLRYTIQRDPRPTPR
ncbi:class I SAM-dependent methyltransferase [Achromobacter xylosoxidans]|uniref:class I SAM-dependent methyltransferase n=1 Tax=Alcaligenes xylosoxydans xylosoxydans TaxID=85698 RepID=UPI0004B0A9C5|nr:class I SAM-dependent methyltransferase [Achromobacter xylosoxidans]MCH4592124.1 class I SAM-dependent methyltransferase [Achromobacter xylosoxidans]CUJ61398.1 O-Methyltransferase involved in polyketide biosynthesis [Achromobacter xylosoxidans]